MHLLSRVFSLFLTLTLCSGLSAQGIDFFHGTWAEALEKAAAEDKLIFVDAYASWCGPCKRMAAQVFPLQEVGDYFNEHFINVKFDMEKAESKEFRRKHSVRAYPTLMFINAKNEVVHKTVGGKQAISLIEEGAKAVLKMDDLEQLAERWARDDHTPQLALKYIRAMVRQEENHVRITNDYLRQQKDLTLPEHLDILLVASTTADSRIFDLMVENREAIVARVGQQAFDDQVALAITAMKNRALEYDDQSMLEEAMKKYSAIDAAAAKTFILRTELEAAAAGKDGKAFYKAAKKYLAKGARGDSEAMYSVFQLAKKKSFMEDKKTLDLVVDAAAEAAALDTQNGFRKYYGLAQYLHQQGDPARALTYAQSAKNAVEHLPAGKRKSTLRAIDGLISQIKAAR